MTSDADELLDRLHRILSRSRSLATSTETGVEVTRALESWRAMYPGARLDEPDWLRAALQELLDPDPQRYWSIGAVFRPNQPQEATPTIDLPVGWSVLPSGRWPGDGWLTTVLLAPPEGDVLAGVAAILHRLEKSTTYSPSLRLPDGFEVRTSYEGPAHAVATLCPNTVQFTAHRAHVLGSICSELTGIGAPPDDDEITTLLANAALRDVSDVLSFRSEWRAKHPRLGIASEVSLGLLQFAPLHLSAYRQFEAGSLSPGSTSINWFCDEVKRLDPTRPSPPFQRERLAAADRDMIAIASRWMVMVGLD